MEGVEFNEMRMAVRKREVLFYVKRAVFFEVSAVEKNIVGPFRITAR